MQHSLDRWVAAFIENGVVDKTQSLVSKIQNADADSVRRATEKFKTWSILRLPSWVQKGEPEDDDDLGVVKSYDEDKCIGCGSGGMVFRSGEDRAIKVMTDCLRRPQRAMYERKVLMEIRNPYIVRGFSAWFDPATHRPCLEMEFAPYGPLGAVIPKPSMIEWLAPQLHSAMTAFQNYEIIHGDIRPTNILVFGPRYVKVCDFELAMEYECAMPETWYRFCKPISSSMEWAPECYEDEPPADEDLHRVDMWGVGRTLYGAYKGGWSACPHDLQYVKLGIEKHEEEDKDDEWILALRDLLRVDVRKRSDVRLRKQLITMGESEGAPIEPLVPTPYISLKTTEGGDTEKVDKNGIRQRRQSMRTAPFVTMHHAPLPAHHSAHNSLTESLS